MKDPDSFPNIQTLLTKGCVSPIDSTEAECAAYGIQWLKMPYWSTMSDSREGDLNLIQLQKVAEIFLNLNQRFFQSNSVIQYQ